MIQKTLKSLWSRKAAWFWSTPGNCTVTRSPSGQRECREATSKFGSQTGENPDALETSDIWVWHLEVSWLITEFILVHLLNFADKEKLLQESLKMHIIYTGWGDLVLPAFFPTATLNARWAMFIVLRGKMWTRILCPSNKSFRRMLIGRCLDMRKLSTMSLEETIWPWNPTN